MVPPRSVELAVKLIWASLAAGACNGLLATWRLAQGRSDAVNLLTTLLVVAFGILGALYWLSTKIRKGRMWARAVYVVLMGLSLFNAAQTAEAQFHTSVIQGLAFSASSVLGYAAAALLFTRSAREWFRLDGRGPNRVA
jgi:hypothetical protein